MHRLMEKGRGGDMAQGSDGMDIMVVPVGPVVGAKVAEIVAILAEVFRCRAGEGDGVPLPVEGWNPGRRQHLSSSIIAVLHRRKPAGVPLLLGVIDRDLYLPPLNFVFGEADMGNGVAVISLARLSEEFYGRPPDDRLCRRRAATEAVHEVGHTLGLGHCPDERCVMHFSNPLTDTDRKGPGFCLRCRERLDRVHAV